MINLVASVMTRKKEELAVDFRQRLQIGTGMEKDILSAIVEVEEDIQEQLVAEERSAGAKLCSLKQELADESKREEGKLAEAMQQAVTAARAEAQERAAAIVHRAATLAEQVTGLDDSALGRCIIKHLFRIVPGESR